MNNTSSNLSTHHGSLLKIQRTQNQPSQGEPHRIKEMASLRLALRLSREASEAPAPAPADAPPDAPPARPKKKKPSKRKPKAAAARPKPRSRKPPATAVGGGTLEKLPWELLGAVAKYLTVEDAARWRGCGRSSAAGVGALWGCLLYTSPSPRDGLLSRMPSSA